MEEADDDDDDAMGKYLKNFGPNDDDDATEETVSNQLNELALVFIPALKANINRLHAV